MVAMVAHTEHTHNHTPKMRFICVSLAFDSNSFVPSHSLSLSFSFFRSHFLVSLLVRYVPSISRRFNTIISFRAAAAGLLIPYMSLRHMCVVENRNVYVLCVVCKISAPRSLCTLLVHCVLMCHFPHHQPRIILGLVTLLRFARVFLFLLFYSTFSRHLQVNEYSHWTKSTYSAYIIAYTE